MILALQIVLAVAYALLVVVGDLAKIRAGIEALGLGPVQVLSVDEITRE